MKDQKEDKANELFLVVDENDSPLSPLPRKLVHGHGVWHRVSHIWVLDGNGNVLCQQRSLEKELNPGRWESFFGGHLRPQEDYKQGAVRELQEEIGLQTNSLVHLQTYKRFDAESDGYNNEFQGIFSTEWKGDTADLHFDDGEVEQVKWMSLSEVLSRLQASSQDWTNCGYEEELIKRLLSGEHD
jgi:16S rRNA (adenine1518-N6/adenine1519-N6)-dimethyltransferase